VSRYYYFAATLPALHFGAPAAMTSAEFLERCRIHLSEADFVTVSAGVLLSEPASPPPAADASILLRRYYDWERSLRNELVRVRSRRLGRTAEDWLRPAGRDNHASMAAQAALQAESPLEGELILERERWASIEALRAYHSFDLETIAAYRLQLQILERLAVLSAERGEGRYRETYAAILGPAQESDTTGVTR
jgi:hypothetical protein